MAAKIVRPYGSFKRIEGGGSITEASRNFSRTASPKCNDRVGFKNLAGHSPQATFHWARLDLTETVRESVFACNPGNGVYNVLY
jgi:hypothetical protein